MRKVYTTIKHVCVNKVLVVMMSLSATIQIKNNDGQFSGTDEQATTARTSPPQLFDTNQTVSQHVPPHYVLL